MKNFTVSVNDQKVKKYSRRVLHKKILIRQIVVEEPEMKKKLNVSVVLRKHDNNSPPRSCILTPVDNFLCGQE